MNGRRDGHLDHVGSHAGRFRVLEPSASGHLLLISSVAPRAIKRPPNTYLFLEGDLLRPLILVDGWVSLQRMLQDGRRQIFGFALPGDVIGSPSRMTRAGYEAVCLTPAALADASQLVSEFNSSSQAKGPIGDALADSEALSMTVTLNHLMRLGRLTSFERVGHFLLETEYRLGLAGFTSNHSFILPVTQEVLADYLGLSIVHINRTLQQLKREGLIERRGNLVALRDRETLAQICHYARPDQRRRQCA